MTQSTSDDSLLQRYIHAVESRNVNAVCALFDEQGLAEIPLIKPARLIGANEIRKAHQAISDNLAAVAFSVENSLAQLDVSIAEGRLTAQRQGGQFEEHHFGLVVVQSAARIRRMSLYFDSRGYRMWCDETIM